MLVIKPGVNAGWKEQIENAFKRIAEYFEHSLDVKQASMEILETIGTALVPAKTIISVKNQSAIERKATYVFKKILKIVGYGQLIIPMATSYSKQMSKLSFKQ